VIIATALCIYMLFNLTNINIRQGVDIYYQQSNVNDLHVQLVRIPASALRELRRLEGVDEVQGRVSFDVNLQTSADQERATLRLISLPPDGERINRLFWLQGMPALPEANDIIMLQQFAEARAFHLGDTVTPVINGTPSNMKVSGIVANVEFVYLMENDQALLPAPEKFGVGYINEAFARHVFGFSGSYNELLITLKPGANHDQVIDGLEKQLDRYGLQRITKLEDQLSHNLLMQKMDGIEKMQVILPVLFLLVAAIVIVIMLSRIVNNDRIPIGVMKGLGYSDGQILLHYSKYALAMGLIGAAVGIAGGIVLSGPMTRVFVYYFNIPVVRMNMQPGLILNALLLTGGFCVASGLMGARPVLQITPADAMRPAPPRSGKRVALEQIPALWQRLSVAWKMVVRNIVRAKRRFMFLVLGLGLAYAITTVPLYQSNALAAMFDLQYGVYQKMDYTITLTNPRLQTVQYHIKELVPSKAVEPRLEYPFLLTHGWIEKSAILIGVPADTVFYEFRDASNRLLQLKPGMLFLTEALAKTLRVKTGDVLVIRNFMPDREDVTVQVGGIVKQYLGSNAFMDLKTMQDMLMGDEIINGVNVATTADVKAILRNADGVASVKSANDMKSDFLEFMDTIVLATRAYMFFGGILSFALIYNATLIGIMERSQEFSAMRVMGYSSREIFSIISRETLLMAACAIGIGVFLGRGMMISLAESFSTEMVTFPRLYPARIFVEAAVALIVFVLIAQLATYRKIKNLQFVDVLKSWIS
jgi:putative ABC transport system permease protein